jgi:hypothetical protein
VLLLIDKPERRPSPPAEPHRPSLRPLLPIPIVLFVLGIAGMVPPVPSYLLILAACTYAGRTLSKRFPDSNGLRDHRQ